MRLRSSRAIVSECARVGVALGVALSAGCALLFSPEPYGDLPPPRACQTDDQCVIARGEVCRRADGSGSPSVTDEGFTGICVIPSSGSRGKVFLEVRPEAGSSVPTTQVGPIDLSLGQNQEISLPAPVLLEGEVLYQGALERRPVPRARVRLRSRPLISGRPLTFDTETVADRRETEGQFGRLVPQGVYTVTVQPPDVEGVRVPPERQVEDLVVDASLRERLVLAVSHPSELLEFTARAAILNKEGKVPLAGAEVWAVDSGNPALKRSDGSDPLPTPTVRLLTQPSVTAADGAFTLWFPRRPELEPHSFQLRFGPAPDGPQLPSFRPDQDHQLDKHTRMDEPIVLGRFEAERPVSGVVLDDRLQPVSGARVTFRTVAETPFVFSVTAQTDAMGLFDTALPPGRYHAVAQPPAGRLAHCPLGHEVEVAPDQEINARFYCETRRWLTGRVLDPLGVPVSGVAVDAVRRADETLPDELHEQSRTNADGDFRLFLAPGSYDLLLRPLPDSKLPYKTIRGIVVDDSVESLLVVELDAPFELFGRLLGGEQTVPLGATLEAYAVTDEGSTVLVGRGLSTSDGRYSIVLPASAP